MSGSATSGAPSVWSVWELRIAQTRNLLARSANRVTTAADVRVTTIARAILVVAIATRSPLPAVA